MKATLAIALAGATLSITPAFAAPTAEMYSPALPANFSQYMGCVIINVSGSSQTVTTEAFRSDGVQTAGPYTETLGHGQGGGFSVPGTYASYYCKFTVSGAAKGYRASIEVTETLPAPEGYTLKVALPAS